MVKKADGPSTGRAGFGYEQARNAGVPWSAIKPRSAAQINADRQENAKSDETTASFVASNPWLRERAKVLRSKGLSDREVVAELIKEAKKRLARKVRKNIAAKASKKKPKKV